MNIKEKLAELLSYMESQMASFKELLPPEQKEQVGKADDWSARDNLVHSLVWAERRLAILETARGGEDPVQVDYGDFDQANLEIFQEHQGKTWDEIHSMIRDSFAGIAAYLQQVSEEYLHSKLKGEEQSIWRSIVNNYLMHPMIHLWDYLRNQGCSEKIGAVFGEGFFQELKALDKADDWQGLVEYNRACLLALSGEAERSLQGLEKALSLNPGLKEWSQQDPDLESLRERAEYLALYEDN